MIRKILFTTVALAATITVFGASSASAQVSTPVTPQGTFGAQPTLTFGGSGIPNQWVMTNSNETDLGVQLALTATQRYSNPAVTNNGAGTFYALPGTDLNPPGPVNPFALWNFDFAITGSNASLYGYRLWYDFNPAAGNFGDYGSQLLPSSYQDSWNLGMDFLATSDLFRTAPGFASFNPNASGEYGFALVAFNQDGLEVGHVLPHLRA